MKLTETAMKNYQLLFANHSSRLDDTDPEFLQIFANFTFGEAMSHGQLEMKTRLMVILAALVALHALSEYKVMLHSALNVGVTPVEVKEIIYHSVPYAGSAFVFDFIHATNDIFSKRGIEPLQEGQSTTDQQNRLEQGLAVQKQIFGEAIDRNYEQAPANQLHLQRYLSANCFGDYYTRGGLDLPTRELLTFITLLSLGGCEPQLKAHIAANAKLGNDKELLLAALTQVLPYIGYPRTLNAISCLNEVLPEA